MIEKEWKFPEELNTEFCNDLRLFMKNNTMGRTVRGEKLRCVQRIMDSADYLAVIIGRS